MSYGLGDDRDCMDYTTGISDAVFSLMEWELSYGNGDNQIYATVLQVLPPLLNLEIFKAQ